MIYTSILLDYLYISSCIFGFLFLLIILFDFTYIVERTWQYIDDVRFHEPITRIMKHFTHKAHSLFTYKRIGSLVELNCALLFIAAVFSIVWPLSFLSLAVYTVIKHARQRRRSQKKKQKDTPPNHFNCQSVRIQREAHRKEQKEGTQ